MKLCLCSGAALKCSFGSAPAAAMGTLTPMPCVPVPAGGWKNPNSKVLIGGRPALTSSITLTCTWGGQISVQFAGRTSVEF